MRLFFLRDPNPRPQRPPGPPTAPIPGATPRPAPAPRPMQIVEVDLAKLFADSAAGKLKSADAYQRVCGTTPAEIDAGGDMALDGDENWAYFRVGRAEAAKHMQADAKIEKTFGPRNMGAGPAGIAALNVHTVRSSTYFGGVSDRAYPDKSVGARRDRFCRDIWQKLRKDG